MKKSITWKVFGVFIIFQIIFCFVLIAINYFFLDEMFVRGNRASMNNAYHEILKSKENAFTSLDFLREIQGKTGAVITVVDLNRHLIVSSNNQPPNRGIPENIRQTIRSIDENNTRKPSFEVVGASEKQDKALVMGGRLAPNIYIIMRKQYGIVMESKAMAFRFIGISAAITFFIGTIGVFIISKRLTSPIKKINEAAQEISNLKFDKKLDLKSEDEIGELSKSINKISLKLSKALYELKDANEELKQDLEEKDKLERMRRKFVSTVSHELKNPISMIQGYADGLKHNIAKTEEDKKYYHEVIIDESKKMSRLIQDLLDLSSYESGSFKIDKTRLNISKLIEEVSEKNRKRIEEKGVDLKVESIEDKVVLADKLRIEQVITNFISNAYKNVESGGDIKVKLEEFDKRARISVYNSGSNIPTYELENIWTSFYKLNSKEGKNKTGTGLGLSIVRAIVELHDGSYGVENLEEGVEFWVEIPA